MIIETTLREFHSMLFSADIHIHTDHHNLTFANLTLQRVLQWHLFIEEFAPTFHYIKRSTNVIADALSRLPIDTSSDPLEGKSTISNDLNIRGLNDNPTSSNVPSTTSFSIVMDDCCMLECFLHHPDPNDIAFPLYYPLLQQQQFKDLSLQNAHQQHLANFPIQDFSEVQLMCFVQNPGDSWKIAFFSQALNNIVCWYHQVLNHIGMTQLYLTITTHFYHP